MQSDLPHIGVPKKREAERIEFQKFQTSTTVVIWKRTSRVKFAPAKNEEEKGEKRKREVEKEENETGTVKRRFEDCVSVETYEIFIQEGDLGKLW